MSIHKLTQLISPQFLFLLEQAQLNRTWTKCMFHPDRIKMHGKTLAYDGYMGCGLMSKVTSMHLTLHKVPHEVVRCSLGYGKYIEDHVFLRFPQFQNQIIDPTYKQWMRDCRSKKGSPYDKYVYEVLPPVYFGHIDTLLRLYESVAQMNSAENPYGIITIRDIEPFWENPKVIY